MFKDPSAIKKPSSSPANTGAFGRSLPNFTKGFVPSANFRNSLEDGEQVGLRGGRRPDAPSTTTTGSISQITTGGGGPTRSQSPNKLSVLKLGQPRAVNLPVKSGTFAQQKPKLTGLPRVPLAIPSVTSIGGQTNKKRLMLFSAGTKKQPPSKMPDYETDRHDGSFQDPFENDMSPENHQLIDSSQKPLFNLRETKQEEFLSFKRDAEPKLSSKTRAGLKFANPVGESLLKLSSRDRLVPLEDGYQQVDSKNPPARQHPSQQSENKISHLFTAVGNSLLPKPNKDLREGTTPLESSAEKSLRSGQHPLQKQQTNQSNNLDNFFKAMASFQSRPTLGVGKVTGPYGPRIEKSSMSMLEGSFPNPELKLKVERLDFLASQEVFLTMFARREQALARWRKIKTVVKGSSLLRAVDSKDFIAVFEGRQQPRREQKNYVIMPSSWVKFLIYLVKIAALFYNFFYIQIV